MRHGKCLNLSANLCLSALTHDLIFCTRLEGPVEPDELITRLRTVVSDNEVALIAARAER